MTTFEYRTLSYPLKRGLLSQHKGIDKKTLTEQLNKLGRDGWELTGQITEQANGFSRRAVFVLKRALPAELEGHQDEEE